MGVRSGPKIPSRGSEFELVENNWSSGTTTGWVKHSGSSTASVVSVGGVYRFRITSTANNVTYWKEQIDNLVVGHTYVITLNCHEVTSANEYFYAGSSSVGQQYVDESNLNDRHMEFTFTATSASLYITIGHNCTSGSNQVSEWSGISVKPVTSPLILSLDAMNAKSYPGDPVINLLDGESTYGHGSTWEAVDSPPSGLDSAISKYIDFGDGNANSFASSSGKVWRNIVNNPAPSNDTAYNNNGGIRMTTYIDLPSGGGTGDVILSFWCYVSEGYTAYAGDGLGGYMNFRDGSSSLANNGWSYIVDGVASSASGVFNADLNRWKHVVLKADKHASSTKIGNFYLYRDRCSAGKMYIAHLSLEERTDSTTHAVPFAASSRSATSGWKDLSGRGNHGTLTNDASIGSTHFRTGNTITMDGYKEVAGLDFDGTDDSINLSNFASSFNFGSNPFSISVWLQYASGNAQPDRIFEKLATGYVTLIWYVGNKVMYQGNNGSSWDAGVVSAVALTNDVWAHVCVTKTGTTVTMYINGSDAVTGTAHSDYNDTTSGSAALGTAAGGSGNPWKGKIANFQIYNAALTHAQVKDMYNSQKSRFGL